MPSYARNVFELTKARLASFVILTTVVAFLVATRGPINWIGLFWTTVGTAFSALGANAFNQCLERHRDGKMHRTRKRPLPSGRMTLPVATATSAVLSIGGVLILFFLVNPLTSGLALLVHALYLSVYTPLKPKTPTNTLIGAVCGAIPPMMGWTAVTNSIDPGAWLLFLILFVWQMPHFLALAWLYREDYERGGYQMLPAVDRTGEMTGNQVVLYSAALLPLGLATVLAGLAGWIFLVGAIGLSLCILVLAIQLRERRDNRSARRVFLGSLAYLPLLLGLLVIDRGPVHERGWSIEPSAAVTDRAEAPLDPVSR